MEGEVAMTNTLCVHFPEAEATGIAISMLKAFKELGLFGDIARLEVPPGDPSLVVVSYYDMRNACAAFAALQGRCSVEPWYGDHMIVADGSVELQPWMLAEVCEVVEGDCGEFVLVFFDTRSAERAAYELFGGSFDVAASVQGRLAMFQARGALTSQLLNPKTILGLVSEDSWATGEVEKEPELEPASEEAERAPRYRTDLRLSEVSWVDLASGWDTRTTLQLNCMPRQFCAEEAFKTLLMTASLSEHADCYRIFFNKGKRTGSVLINAPGAEGTAALAKYFHGRRWGRSLPVSVSFAVAQGRVELRKAKPSKTLVKSAAGKESKLVSAEPRHIEALDLSACGAIGVQSAGFSEVSTDASDDEKGVMWPPGLGLEHQRAKTVEVAPVFEDMISKLSVCEEKYLIQKLLPPGLF